MAKTKPRATIMVADGAGGMMKVEDRRFEKGDWPIQFQVPEGDQADTWMSYVVAECRKRGGSSSGIQQLEARENSGTLTINNGRPGEQQLAVVWERKRGGPINVCARSSGTANFPAPEAQKFFDQANEQCAARVTERVYWWYQLSYDGPRWLGELWLDDTLRLGPPSRQDDTALNGPRIIIVNAMVDCINPGDVSFVFQQDLRELSAFLSVVMRRYVRVPEQGRAWTSVSGASAAECAVRNLGYLEADGHQTMPPRGASRSMPLRATDLPADGLTTEQSLRADVVELWTLYRGLTAEKRRQFLRAATKWQEALMHWSEKDTLSFALMVVACEALKPSDPEFSEHNIYQLIEALLGKPVADRLRQRPFPAQWVRSSHLHAGEFHGSELIRTALMSSYQDPNFDEARRELTRITPTAIIEWLKRGGEFPMAVRKRNKTLRRLVRDYALIILPVAIAVGVCVGWIARIFWYE
jgi:hypothetical protein